MIDPQLVGIPIIGNIDVEPSIVVEIDGDYSQSMAKLFVYAGSSRYVFKGSISFVVKETIAGRAKHPRRAIVSRSRGGKTVRAISNRKIGVVHNHQIKPAIAVVIEEGCTCAPARIVGSAFLCNIDKLSIALVQVHLI